VRNHGAFFYIRVTCDIFFISDNTACYFYIMIYCIDPTADEPIMLLNKHIGFDEDDGMGIDGSIFQQELLQIDRLDKKRIQVWINSPGGVVTDGYSIYSAILKSNTPVDTYCLGAAASIAGVIFQAGRKRIMADYSWLMYHDPFGGENTQMLDVMKASIVKMIEQRCGMSDGEVSDMMKRTSFIPSSEALEMKLCDIIDPSISQNTKYLKKITNHSEFQRECNLVLNTIINPKINTIMFPKVTMRLKLNDSAPEVDIVAAIDAIENRAKLAEEMTLEAITEAQNKAKVSAEELDKLKAKFEKAEAARAKAQSDYEDCKSQLDALEFDKKAGEEKAKETEAKNMVEGFAKIGRIKNEEVIKLAWVNLAKVDFDGTKNMIEALPLNKVAATLAPEANKIGEKELPTNAMGLSVRNRLKREGKL
jgi:ATP-dependent Clp protease protease subunit